MKIISLNAWAGRCTWALARFFRKYRDDVDVFCLQEIHDTTQVLVDRRHPDEFVRGDIFQIIADELPDHVGVFAVHEDDPVRMSNAMFIRRGMGSVQVDSRVVFQPEVPKEHGSIVCSARKLQWARIDRLDDDVLWIGNAHGLWVPGSKADTPERIAQSEAILKIAAPHDGPKVLVGDFNVYPQTESWRMLFRAFDTELVMRDCISTTRTPLYRHFQDAKLDAWPIDFCFISGAEPKDFRRLPDIVSDHAPLYLEME